MQYSAAKFLMSAAKLSQLPPDRGREVAFAGRSNAGKSSGLNAITGIKNLARTSKLPGRTQLINLFALDEGHRLVDLPGYGYAKVSESIKQEWQQTLGEYLRQRACLSGLVLFMDIRHPLKAMDSTLVEWAVQNGLPTHILLTKADKLSRGAGLCVLHAIKDRVRAHAQVTVQLFSALEKMGVDAARAQLTRWLYS